MNIEKKRQKELDAVIDAEAKAAKETLNNLAAYEHGAATPSGATKAQRAAYEQRRKETQAALKEQMNDGFAAEAEKRRLQEIDEIALAVNDEALVHEAKYGDYENGIRPYSAAVLALKAMQKRAKEILYADVDAGVMAVKNRQ